MHWAAFTLILLGAAAETDGGGEALAARRRLVTRPYFVPPPDLTKNWLVHGADHRGARADWNPVCRRYEARTPPLAAAAARLRSQDQSIKRGPAPTLEEPRVAGNATRTEDVVALVRTTWARYCRNVVPAYRTWAALLPDAYAVAQEPNRSHAWINELPREMLDYRRDIRPGEQKRGPKGVRVPLYYGWKLMRYGRRGTLSRPVVVASQCRHVSHRNPCCAADAQLRFAHDLLSRGSKAKWFLLVDDDVFVHTYALARALATLDPAKALAVVAPATRDRAGACAGLASPYTAKVVSCKRIVGPEATGETCHIIFDHKGNMPYWEGQSYGVIPPGTNPKNGKPHTVRLYSIASSRYGDNMAGKTSSLCVRRATYWDPDMGKEDPAKKGVCSNFLCDATAGEQVKMTGPTGKVMLMPEEKADTDYIMVATGTGIAPYRGFIRRLFTETTPAGEAYKGLAWLFLGVANSDALLYDEEWQAAKSKFPDNFRVDYALSREEKNKKGGKMYIQDKVEEYADEIFERLQNGAVMYFCGLKGMMPGIQDMLKEVCRKKGLTYDDFVADLKKKGQWRVEVY